MDTLFQRSERLVSVTSMEKKRYLYDEINWRLPLIGVKGSRGTGKTTLLLQRLKELGLPARQAVYLTLDDLYFTSNSIVDFADDFYQKGGKHLFLDEVHKYPDWARSIKNLHDQYPDLQIVFTGSSIIDIAREEGDLSRRVLMYQLWGLSFREYLSFASVADFTKLSLDNILSEDRKWRQQFTTDFKPLAYFGGYLKYGYYPFSFQDVDSYLSRLQQLVRVIVEYDMASLHDFDIRNAKRMLQLLYILSENVPFKPNISALAKKSQIHRSTVGNYLYFLEQAKLIRALYPPGISVALLQKPEKLYLDNTNLSYALSLQEPDIGNIRETFFASQVGKDYRLNYPKKGDFLVNDKYLFEIGGKSKTRKQIAGEENAYVVIDDQDFPVDRLPLWIFGFLY